MIGKTYRASPGARFSHKKAQVYGQALDLLEVRLGHPPTTEEIVREASRNHSPLHDYFDWNVRRAAVKYWKVQARELVNHIMEFTVESGKEEMIRARFNVETVNGKTSYVSRSMVERDPRLREQVIGYAQAEAENWAAKYSRYLEFRRVRSAIRMTGRMIRKRKKKGA